MMSFETIATIRRPISEVFEFVSDLSNIPLWQQGVVESHVVTPGPTRVGTIFEEDVRVAFFHLPTRCVVTALEPDRLMAFEATSTPLRYRVEFRFEAVPEGTSLAVRGTGEMRGLWKLLEPVLQADARKSLKDEVGRIKSHLESETRT